MIDFTEDYYYNHSKIIGESEEKAIARKETFSMLIPIIIQNELTKKQSDCFRMKYIEKNTQQEIADKLKVCQPTVSNHINSAKDTINNTLKYCYLAMSKGIDEYEKQMKYH